MKVERIKKSSSHHFPIIFPAEDVAGKFVHEVYGLSAVSIRLTVAYPYNNYTTKESTDSGGNNPERTE